jgi:DNA-binding response OmpR family regulator
MAVKRAYSVVPSRNDSSPPGARASRRSPPEHPRATPWRVVVMENLRERGHGLRDLLLQDRFEVVVVEDARGALERLAEELVAEGRPPPELLICNARMLGEPGLALLERWCHAHPWVPVILVSAFTNPRLRARMERLPVHLVLDQSFALEDVRSAALAMAESSVTS